MTTPINTSSFAKALWPGVNAWYGKAYNEYPVEWDKLFDKNTSRRNFEEDVGVTSFGLAVEKPEGAPISYDTEKQGFTTRYRHTVYALGFVITREIMEDDLYDVVGQRRAQGLAFSMRQTKEIVGANVYNRAFTAGYTGGDGSIMCVSTHPNVAGGTWSNVLATASDLSEAALEQACIDIQSLTNDRGLAISLIPEKLIIPVELEFEAYRILKATGRVGTDLNDPNALKEMGKFRGGVVINHYLTDADAWFIRTNAPHGMKYFERRGDEFGTDEDFDTENAKFKATARYSFGWTDPRGVFASPGA
jgi:hypothetical protein